MTDEIQKADPGAPRRLLLALALAALAGAALIFAFEQHRDALFEWLGRDPERAMQRIRGVLVLLAVAGALPLLAGSLLLQRLAARVRASDRFPPPGSTVLRDTPVLRAERAQAQARRLQLVSRLLGLLAVVLVGFFWWMIHRLQDPGA